MSGAHGHVIPRPDGWKARCGGPALCSVCAAELAQVQEKETTATALLSLAAEFDGKARDWHQKASQQATAPDAGGRAAAIGRAYEGAAGLARQRAQDHPGAPSSTSPAQEDPDLTLVGLSPAQAYEAGVKAERERCALLAEEHHAITNKVNPGGVYNDPHNPAVISRPFADVIRENGDD